MILKNLEKYNIILASKSPRRKQLLEELGIDFKVFVIESIPEDYPIGLEKNKIPVYLAEQKANAYLNYLKENTLLVTADTIVWQNDKVLGKPKNREEAFEIVKQLSGNIHQVITGVCILTNKKQTSIIRGNRSGLIEISKLLFILQLMYILLN